MGIKIKIEEVNKRWKQERQEMMSDLEGINERILKQGETVVKLEENMEKYEYSQYSQMK